MSDMIAISRELKIAVGIVAVIILLGGGVWFSKGRLEQKGREGVFAVFLTNNQVYFGRVEREDRRAILLTNIYYIQPKEQNQPPSADISLLKLGNEVHGPEDMMEINRDQILFIEKLKPDGRVAKAIAEYKPEK